MSHSCQQTLCVTPHYEECYCDTCEFCHEGHLQNKGWRCWNIYPQCSYCEEEMFEEIQPLLDEYKIKEIPR